MKQYNWVSIGCGVIANELAEAMAKEGRHLYGIANRTYEKALDFSKKYNVPVVYQDIDEVFLDDNVDIVYISTPHNTHQQYLKKALTSGKHVLCEKSITLNTAELKMADKLAVENHLVLSEAMTLYHMPLYKRVKEIIETGALGPLRMIQVNFGSYKEYDMSNRFFSPNLAGGALLDIGIYALSFARWFFSETPIQVVSQVKFAPSGVDEQAGILLMNEAEEMATISLTLHAKQPKRGMVAFDKGYIEVYEFPRGHQATITYTEDGSKEVIEAGDTGDALLYEIQDMEHAVSGGENMMHLDYTKDVMKIMTEIRESWGMLYPEEK